MRPVRVEYGASGSAGSYPVYAEQGALARLPRIVAALDPSRVVIVTDATVWRLYGRGITGDLAHAGLRAPAVRIPAGERNKTADRVRRIYDGLLAARCDRDSVLLAVGGGIVGDLAGFAASSFYRGIRYVQVPTTLLAQLDSSVGGKTGYNLPQGKNLVGAFHHPAAVVADSSVLGTLPPRQVRAALAEAIKVGVVADGALFRYIDRHAASIVAVRPVETARVIRRAVVAKARIVSEDEREGGIRRILNFGHTVGHAIETAGAYRRVLHGEAVALGMVAECRLGEALGVTPPGVTASVKNLLKKVGLPDKINKKLLQPIAEWIHYDKKLSRAAVRMFLPVALGSAAEVCLTPGELIRLLSRRES